MYQRLYLNRSHNIQTVRTFGKRSIRIPQQFLKVIDDDIQSTAFFASQKYHSTASSTFHRFFVFYFSQMAKNIKREKYVFNHKSTLKNSMKLP